MPVTVAGDVKNGFDNHPVGTAPPLLVGAFTFGKGRADKGAKLRFVLNRLRSSPSLPVLPFAEEAKTRDVNDPTQATRLLGSHTGLILY